MSIREERWGLGMVSSGQNGRTFSGSCLQHTSRHIECSFQINVTFLPCPCSSVIFFLSQYGLKLGLFLLQRHCFCNLPPLQLLCIGEGQGPQFFLVLRCLSTRVVARVTGTENQRGPGSLPISGVNTCPNFQRMRASTAEDFFHFV
jgi:hypothetical protein